MIVPDKETSMASFLNTSVRVKSLRTLKKNCLEIAEFMMKARRTNMSVKGFMGSHHSIWVIGL